MNKVLLVGRIVRDPETKDTTSGIKYTRFTIAVNRPYGDNEADFVPVVAWRQSAEFLQKYVNKGDLLSVDGRFTSSSYKNQEGNNITRYEVTADRVQILSSKNGNKNNSASKQTAGSNTNGGNVTTFAEETKSESKTETSEVPWELDL